MYPGNKIEKILDGIIHSETQISENSMDLTVSKIYKPRSKGRVDFGGGEREDAKTKEIKPVIKDPENDYGWWDLKPGDYLLKYNESLRNNKLCFIEPLPRITKNFATHPSYFTKNLGPMLLHVGSKGISIKENSRVSKVLVFEFR